MAWLKQTALRFVRRSVESSFASSARRGASPARTRAAKTRHDAWPEPESFGSICRWTAFRALSAAGSGRRSSGEQLAHLVVLPGVVIGRAREPLQRADRVVVGAGRIEPTEGVHPVLPETRVISLLSLDDQRQYGGLRRRLAEVGERERGGAPEAEPLELLPWLERRRDASRERADQARRDLGERERRCGPHVRLDPAGRVGVVAEARAWRRTDHPRDPRLAPRQADASVVVRRLEQRRWRLGQCPDLLMAARDEPRRGHIDDDERGDLEQRRRATSGQRPRLARVRRGLERFRPLRALLFAGDVALGKEGARGRGPRQRQRQRGARGEGAGHGRTPSTSERAASASSRASQ
jgi:hypothetical protein